MIPFEEEASLNETEEYVERLLQARWDNVVRSTPGVKSDLEGRFPELSETISRRIREDSGGEFSNVFRPGVPDFLVFDDSGEYLFVEVKSSDDGLRSTQLRWLRDFQGVNMEIWFADSKDIEKLDADDFGSYGFSDVKKNNSSYELEERNSNLWAQIPDELAAILGLDEESSVEWRLKSGDELILDNR
ncbi:hypothetical protein GKQ38_01975 [Candidatus Nanohaloarchaea archaeon]|nr:hypothetical protein GKQ38_01975 [Candidatus Nanohaloarchaea archaeon]